MADGHKDRPPAILCAGIAVIDQVFRIDTFPETGTKARAREFTSIGGGCAANAAVAIARLGGRGRLVAPLGGPSQADIAGDAIVAFLAREGVDCSAIVRIPGVTSPVSAILVDGTGERTIMNFRDDALTSARHSDPDALVREADAVMIDNRFADFVLPIAQAARKADRLVLMDADEPTVRNDELMAACTHIVFSADGLRATVRIDSLSDALPAAAARTQALVAVTDGACGVLWRDGTTLRAIPAIPVTAVDTLAAGDVFHGACVLALAEGMAFERALAFAAAAAAIKCKRFGGIAGAPSRAEVDRLMGASKAP